MTHVGLLVNHLDFCNTNNVESLTLITYGVIQVKMVEHTLINYTRTSLGNAEKDHEDAEKRAFFHR